jgi:alkylation response protein AidB-like acyl-CoA dehydrogenase
MTALSKGAVPGPESSIGKVINANRLQDITNAAIEAQDHYGIVVGGPDDVFGEAYMWAPGLRIAGGSDEILKNIIAERVLRLPPEQRVDKDRPFRDIPTGSAKK